MTDNELLGYACEQFLGKTVAEIKSVILQTLEGHLRSILGEWRQTLVSILNGTLLPSLWRILDQSSCQMSNIWPATALNRSLKVWDIMWLKASSAFTVHLENVYILYNGRLQSISWSMKMRKHHDSHPHNLICFCSQGLWRWSRSTRIEISLPSWWGRWRHLTWAGWALRS